MCRRLFVAAAALLFSGVLQSQELSLHEWQAHLNPHDSFQVSFHQVKSLNHGAMRIESSGQMFVDRSAGVVWQTESPFMSTMCWRYDEESTAVMAQWFLDIVTGNVSELARYFNVQLSGPLDAWQVKMTPNNEYIEQAITQIQLSGSLGVEKIEYDEPGGHKTSIELGEATVSLALPNCEVSE